MKVTLGESLKGDRGIATEIISTLEPGDRPDLVAVVSSWFIFAPKQSPVWNHYALSTIHLRDVPGTKPVVRLFPQATHEIVLAALDPREKPQAEDPYTWQYLRLNLCEQIVLRNDAAASAICRAGAEQIVAGRLWAEAPSPGTFEPWRTFLRLHSAAL